MGRPLLIAIAAALLVGGAGFFTWQHLTQLGEQISSLNRQVVDLSAQTAAAETRAREAEARADEAQSAAGEAAERAVQAVEREQLSSEQAKAAEEARQRAEAVSRAAAEERERALTKAQLAERAEAVAEQKRIAAEKEREEAATRAAVAELEARQVKGEKEQVERRLQQELDRLQGALGQIAKTRRTALGLVMTLDSRQIEFDFNKAELRPKNREVLSRIAGVLFTFKDYGVQIFGHTDAIGSVEYNQKLSEQRAEAVKSYLVEAGIPEAALSTLGMGKSSPLVEGTDPESRQRNRRVELAIVFSEGEVATVVDEGEGS